MEVKQLLEEFEAHLSTPEDYLNPSAELRSRCLAGVKTIFDFLQKHCREAPRNSATEGKKLNKASGPLVPTGPLSELYVEGFDADQIWEQIQLVNQPMLEYLSKQVDKICHWDMKKLTGGDGRKVAKMAVSDSEFGSDGGMGVSESDLDEGEDAYFDEGDDERDPSDEENTNEVRGRRRGGKGEGRRTVVDDRFFKLAEMEQFLEIMEKEQQQKQDNSELDFDLASDDDNEDGDDIDYFADIPSDTEGGPSIAGGRGTKRAHYEDFFDAPGDEEEINHPKIKQKATRQEKKLESAAMEGKTEEEREEGERDNLDGDTENESSDGGELGELSEDEELEGEGEGSTDESEAEREEEEEEGEEGRARREEEDGEEEKQQTLSSHERKQQKIQERIAALEEANLSEKPWQMGGEATAKSRPENSLLEEDLSFDHMTRTAPVITEETTKTLEDIIRQRIIDEAWDDVERRVKPKEKPYDYSRARPLDQDKSKLSLAEVYEQEYIKQTQSVEEVKEDERHTEIKEMMKKLFVKLDALSNFHFTPKPPKPEVKIVANVPAIQMEEVAPVATTDAALLAPEEIQVKSKVPEVGMTEKTATNRKRERRLKKKRKRLRLAEKRQREKLVTKLRPGLGNKYTKKSFAKKLQEREEEEKVDKSLRSSSKFFARLQDQVREQVKGATAQERRTKKDRTTRSQHYKL